MIFTKSYVVCIMIIAICQLKSVMSEEHELDDHAKLVAQWNRVSSFNTGYVQTQNSQLVKFDFGRLSKGQLRLAILLKFGQLKCGYLFGAQFHFQTVGTVLQAEDDSLLLDPLTLFLEESVTMVRTFFHVKGIVMNEIWSAYNHAYAMNDFYNVPILNRWGSFRKSEIRKQNRFVLTQLDGYLEQNCGHDNVFNIKYAQSESGKNDLYGFQIAQSTHLGTRKQLFVNKNLLVKCLYEDNLAKGLGNFIDTNIDGAYLKQAIDRKYLKFENSFQTYPNRFMDETTWDALNETTMPLLEFPRNRQLNNLLTFGKLNIISICTLRFLWLQVTCELLRDINRMIHEDRIGTFAPKMDDIEKDLRSYISGFQRLLANVIDKLNINDNCHELLLQLNTIFETDLARYNQDNGYRFEAKDNVVEQLQYEILSASQTLGIPPTCFSVESRYNMTSLLSKAHMVSDEINKIFKSSLEFKLLYSFLNFICECDGRVLMFLNSKPAENHILELVF